MEGMIGEIRMFGGNFAPRSWALCEGQLLAINSNQALFSILGTTYGGDGRTTFALPDLRGRAAIAPGTGPGLPTYRLGQRGGAPTNTLNVQQLPAHNHIVPSLNVAGDIELGVNEEGVTSSNPTTGSLTEANIYNDQPTDGNYGGGVSFDLATASASTGITGASHAVNNMQPYLAVNYIICLQGVFPSRS